MSTQIWVLLKETTTGDETHCSIMGAYGDLEGLEAKLERIRKANPQYALVPIGKNAWRIGPEHDEGFFGNKPVWLRAVETKLN